MKRKIKSNNAITLVALVVTINERRTISWQNRLWNVNIKKWILCIINKST